MNKDFRLWTKSCLHCQRNKVHRHMVSPPGHFPVTDAHVYLDIVGPLPPSYLLTCIDSFTRWPLAIPISDTSAESLARQFL
jgi:hypothetical protein